MNVSDLFMVSTKGQVTIPAAMREKYGIKAGDMVIWEEYKDKLAIKKPVDFFALRGCLGKVEIPEDEEELFLDDVVNHVMKES
ncbi:MAG: AbrB/MazE/SpoVT family DNA-binding domain-containing protein [Synergistaceae bacterium]|nr:AbrB/MazE/SpoVT family DNA-binding domain-containing protein [Synergistaceae bacterium]